MKEAEKRLRRLYYVDVFQTESTGFIGDVGIDEKGRPFAVISPTVFHPHGGGRKGDRGRLFMKDAALAARLGVADGIGIVDTRKGDVGNRHILARELISRPEFHKIKLESVHAILDWNFREMQMRLHSSAHLLHCFVEQVIGRVVSFPETSDLLELSGLNRYEIADLLNQDQFSVVLDKLNKFIAEDHPISTSYDTSLDAPIDGRLWKCAEWTIPCGGTHPITTRAMGTVSGKLSTRRGRTSITFEVH